MIDRKQEKMFFLLLLFGMLLWLMQSLGGYLYAKNNLSGISDNYDSFVNTTINRPNSLHGQTIYFYRSSCKHCQSIIPASYLIKSVMLFSCNDVQFYDVDRKNTNFIQERLNVYKVPTVLNFHKRGTNIIINEIKPLNKDYILNSLIKGFNDLLIIVISVFLLGWIIDTKYKLINTDKLFINRNELV